MHKKLKLSISKKLKVNSYNKNLKTLRLKLFTFLESLIVWLRELKLCSLHPPISIDSHCRGLNGSDFWSNLLIVTPAFSTTLILKPCRFISVWYIFCSCEFGVAGTTFPPRLYQLDFFPIFSCSRSSFFHSLGRCNGLSPSWSAIFLVLYALRVESTTSYLNFLL